jgi:hypothetical protein
MSIWMLACPLMMVGFGGLAWIGSRLSRSRENSAFRPMCMPTLPPRRPTDFADSTSRPAVTADDAVSRDA